MDNKAIENAIPQIWIRLPKAGEICPHTGMKRGSLLNLALRNRKKIKMVHLREPGCKRGNRLIWLPSVHAYFTGLAAADAELPTPEELEASER